MVETNRRGKAYFISDLHLGATYNKEGREVELSAVRFLDSIKNDAGELYLLGDIFDYWFEYKYVVPKGFVRFLGKIAELADSGIKITWLIGNHDIWIFDYIPAELGIEVADGCIHRDIDGVEFCMQHGDAIGGSVKFRLMRGLFRNRFCQKLYASLHPRLTVGFAYRCSRKSRIGGDKRENKKISCGYSNSLISDIRKWCENQIGEGERSKYFVFGHLHKKYLEPLPDERYMVVIPSWADSREYGVFDGLKFSIENFETT